MCKGPEVGERLDGSEERIQWKRQKPGSEQARGNRAGRAGRVTGGEKGVGHG